MIPIYRPHLPPHSLKYAHEALNSGWISSQGKYVEMVAERLQDLLKVKYVLPVFNGTMACYLMSKALQYKFGINEIIVPNNVYVAAWNAFLFDDNYSLFSVDADLNTWNYDLNKLDQAINNHPNAAVLIVHNISAINNVPELQKKYPNTIFVEDACESFSGRYNGVYTGTASFASAFSTFGNKTITSGEGAWLNIGDDETFQYLKILYNQGQSKTRFIHDILGYNFRMTNVQAALLYGQLDILDEILEKKNALFTRYRNALKDREDILPQETAPKTEFSNWMFGCRIPNQHNYSEAETFFKQKGIETRQMFFPINRHKFINENNKIHQEDHSTAEKLNRECLILPSYPELGIKEQDYILETLNDYVKEL
jgi:perosamine synthetase